MIAKEDSQTMYSWVQTHTELVQYLSTMENRQKELIALLKSVGISMFNDQSAPGVTFELEEIDPFTFFCYIYKHGAGKRLQFLQAIAEELNLTRPMGESGIPSANAQKVWLFPYKYNRVNDEIPRLWNFFQKALSDSINDEVFTDVISIRNVGLTKITEALFYILPEKYFPINGPSKPYLAEFLGIDPHFKTYTEYLAILKKIKRKSEKPFYALSYEAWYWTDSRAVNVNKKLIADYKKHIEDNKLQGEKYKWELLSKYQGHPDPGAADLYEEVKQTNFSNLLYALATAVLNHLAKERPDSLRECLVSLFDESAELVERIKLFNKRTLEIYRELDGEHSHHMDERTMATLLAYHNPTKYTFYKSAYYVKYCTLLGLKPAKKDEKYIHYLDLIEDFIDNYISKDHELIAAVKECIPEYYNGTNHLLLAQDILYQMLDKGMDEDEITNDSVATDGLVSETATKSFSPSFYWLNANPKTWRISEFKIGQGQTYTTHNREGNKRRVYKYMTGLKPGDLIIGYEASPIRKVVALLEVVESLHEDEDEGEVFTFSLKEFFINQVTWEDLLKDPVMKISEVAKNNQGSLFKLTRSEFDAILRLTSEAFIKTETYSFADIDSDVFIEKEKIESILRLLKYKKNIILQGPPGTGKTFVAKRLAFAHLGEKNNNRIEMIQFHQSIAYEDFIQGYRPRENGSFELKNGVFYEFCMRVQRDPGNDYFFIIDEINRGNLSKIFGELMMLIEHDKRGDKFAIPLTYSRLGDPKFYIPENLYMIGTMNTADRSLAIVDYALRRRFSFISLEPEFNEKFGSFLTEMGAKGVLVETIQEKLRSLNKTIEQDNDLGWGYQVGHSYFCNRGDGIPDQKWFNMIVENEIKPLLHEYWFDDPDKANNLVSSLYLQ